MVKGELVAITSPGCSHIWLVGTVAGQRGDLLAQHQAFMQALGCSPNYQSLIQAVLPEDQELAQLATQYYPESSDFRASGLAKPQLKPTRQLPGRRI